MKIVNYILVFIAVTAVGMLYDRYSKKFYPDEELDKYNLVRKYLLNEGDSIVWETIFMDSYETSNKCSKLGKFLF